MVPPALIFLEPLFQPELGLTGGIAGNASTAARVKSQKLTIEAQQILDLRRVSDASDGGGGVRQKCLNDAGASRVATILIAGMAHRYGGRAIAEIVGGNQGSRIGLIPRLIFGRPVEKNPAQRGRAPQPSHSGK